MRDVAGFDVGGSKDCRSRVMPRPGPRAISETSGTLIGIIKKHENVRNGECWKPAAPYKRIRTAWDVDERLAFVVGLLGLPARVVRVGVGAS